MKIELDRNKVLFNNGSSIQEIHPFWLRERVDGEEYLDKGTQQRLFDPSSMNSEIIIKKAKINDGFLEIDFNDGIKFVARLPKKLKPTWVSKTERHGSHLWQLYTINYV